MAIFDPVEQRMAVRVVYDGVAHAGKTTNLRQLCALFVAQKKLEVDTPEELRGRTLYFDWMQIMAGVVCGFPLLCQVVSVPGQVVLTPRRRHLLAAADVVVYVCDSHPDGVAAAREGLALYDRIAQLRGVDVPLVIQANKQDQVGALGGPELLAALGREGTPLVEGIATDGVGVVDTFVTAVRSVARSLQSRVDRGSLSVEVRRADTSRELLAQLAHQRDLRHGEGARAYREWAAELVLEEAQAAFLVDEAMTALAADPARRDAAAAAAAALDAPAAPATSVRSDGAAPPAAPSPDVPTGFIWPAHTGREIVRSLALDPAQLKPQSRGDGALEITVRGHVARTTSRARHPDVETARQALVRGARESIQLERLLVPETVLVAQPAPDGACWIWTVRPEVPTVARLLEARAMTPELLAAYGMAVVETLRVALRNGFGVELGVRSFGVQEGALRYLGERLALPTDAADLSSSVVAAASAIERSGADAAPFLSAFERSLSKRLTPEERAVFTTSTEA
ncbi:MAG: gliding motility protein MglA [Labilithrix sp.]|nr:gliding motility protein MglA [Labilithrix sp.]